MDAEGRQITKLGANRKKGGTNRVRRGQTGAKFPPQPCLFAVRMQGRWPILVAATHLKTPIHRGGFRWRVECDQDSTGAMAWTAIIEEL